MVEQTAIDLTSCSLSKPWMLGKVRTLKKKSVLFLDFMTISQEVSVFAT